MQDTFQGVLLLLDEPSLSKAKQVQAALSADNFIDLSPATGGGKKNKPTSCQPFSKSMVTQARGDQQQVCSVDHFLVVTALS